MAVEKLSVSFNPKLGKAIRASAAASQKTVSAWIADAVQDRLRHEALGDYIKAWEEEFGPLTQAEMDEADRILDEAAKLRTSKKGR